PEYLSFVEDHSQEGVQGIVWWEDELWFNDPTNLAFDFAEPGPGYKELTAAEKVLIRQYPLAAHSIKRNRSKAFAEQTARFPGPVGTVGLNDKADAFRHCFFNAMNERDCGTDEFTFESIAKKFSDAHESETPLIWAKEKQMDLWNNEVGQQIGFAIAFPMFTSDATVADRAWDKLANGDLRYLKPVEATPNPAVSNGVNNDFWTVNGDPKQGKHGIGAATQLTRTDQ